MNSLILGFKPYYKWIVLNTSMIPSCVVAPDFCFKPYYKWIVLNTKVIANNNVTSGCVLNLIING